MVSVKDMKYHATRKIRKIGTSQIGIELPINVHGDYAIYSDNDNMIVLVPMEGKR